MYFFALVSIIFNVFIFCYIGDLLAERCQMIGTTCYAIEWYKMPPKKAIELIMPITISRYPATITAGKMMTMTLSTFSDVSNVDLRFMRSIIDILKYDSSEFHIGYVNLLAIDISHPMLCVTIAMKYYPCEVFEKDLCI